MRGDVPRNQLALGIRQQVKPRSSARRKPAGKSPIAPGEVTPGPIPSPGAHPYSEPVRLIGNHGHACGPGCPCTTRQAFTLTDATGEWPQRRAQEWLDELASKLNAEGKR